MRLEDVEVTTGLLGDQTALEATSGLVKRRVRLGVLEVGVVEPGLVIGIGVSSLSCAVIPAFLVEKVGLGALTVDRGETTRSGAKGDTGELMLGPNDVMGGEKQWVDLYEAEGLYGDGNGLEGTEGDLETL